MAGVQLTSVASAEASISSQYLARINQERSDHGRSALVWRPDLAEVAQGWAEHMASSQVLAHNPDLTRQVRNWRVIGENVGVGPTLDDLDRAFMRSPEHRDNILDPQYSEVGVGSVHIGEQIWIVIDFRGPLAPAHAPAAVVRPVAPELAVAHRPAVRREVPIAVRMLRSDLPFAPGCMLRITPAT